MSSFLRSRRNRILTFIFALLIIAILFQATLTYILHKSKSKIENYLSNTFGYRITLKRISFNLLEGLRLNGMSAFYPSQDRQAVYVKDASMNIKILPVFLGRVVVDRIKINEALLLVKREEAGYNLQIMFSDIYKRISKNPNLAFNLSTAKVNVFVKLTKLISIDSPELEKNMFVLLKNLRIRQRLEKFQFNSDIEFNYLLPEDSSISRFIKDKKIRQEAKCNIQGNIEGNNLIMNSIVLNMRKEQILGMGMSRDFIERNPYIDINFIPTTLSLDNIDFLRDNFDFQGTGFISLKFSGLLDNIKTTAAGHLDNCSLELKLSKGSSLDIRNLSTELEYADGQINLKNGYVKLNDLPLNIKLKTSVSLEPRINLTVFSPKGFLTSQNLPLDRLMTTFNGKIVKTLTGDLQINALYIRKGLNLDMQAYFKNMNFDYSNPQEKQFRADTLRLSKVNAYRTQKLSFYNLEARVYLEKNRIGVKGLKATGYNGAVNGRIDLDIGDKSRLSFALDGIGLDVETLMQDVNITDKLRSGNMLIKIAFDNRLKDFLKGRFYIKNGIADLDTLANIIKSPPLTHTHFDIMHTYFAISKDIIKARGIKLYSPDIRLNAFWDTDSKIYGIINLKMAAGLLKQSPQFKKLLNIAKTKDPHINFTFLAGGIPEAVRVKWLKNEFKDKIKQGLAPWIIRSIEKDLDEITE